MLHPGTDNKILRDFCSWEHDFELELAAVTSKRVMNLLDNQNVAAINFAALK